MADKNYLNLHVLIPQPSCLNRDDMNMQKSAVFGGVRRVRISSQCLKHYAVRLAASPGAPSVRTELGSLKENFKALIPTALAAGEEAIDRIAGSGRLREGEACQGARAVEGRRDSRGAEGPVGRRQRAWPSRRGASRKWKRWRRPRGGEKRGSRMRKLSKRVEEASKPLLTPLAAAGWTLPVRAHGDPGLMRPVDGAMSLGRHYHSCR